LGILGADFGVLTSSSGVQIFVAGTEVGSSAAGSTINRVRITLTATQAGSMQNMNWLVQVDQGLTGAFTFSQSGTGANITGNSITLGLGVSWNESQFFTGKALGVVNENAGTNTVPLGGTTTLSAVLSGWPRNLQERWLSNGVPIPGATGLSLVTSPATVANNGAKYSLVVTNLITPVTVVTSSVSTVVLLNRPTVTNVLAFSATSLPQWAGNSVPAANSTTFSGTTLAAGDLVVFDGVAIDTGGDPGYSTWSGVEFNATGYYGIGGDFSALFGTEESWGGQILEGGNVANNQTWTGSATANRVTIVFTATASSAENMNYLVKIDQGLTGTYNITESGTGLNFTANSISLAFAAYGSATVFVPYAFVVPVSMQSAVVNGNTLQLTWPADHTGWVLQSQTNAPGSGLSDNWVTVSGSTSVNTVSFTIDPTQGSVFYRLQMPY
jgi:hypothetical protein